MSLTSSPFFPERQDHVIGVEVAVVTDAGKLRNGWSQIDHSLNLTTHLKTVESFRTGGVIPPRPSAPHGRTETTLHIRKLQVLFLLLYINNNNNNNNPVALQPYRALADRAAAAGQRS